ncbi:MAG: hypothetical protein Q9183_002273, partial [Haloplaca sp. 2 TL-2023]
MLEAALVNDPRTGKLPQPLSGVVFHWDKHSGSSAIQPCEAAYLCTSGIPVTVLVTATNYDKMKAVYQNLPGLGKKDPKPEVRALFLQQKDLNVHSMMKLMAVDESKGRSTLYIE